MFGTIRAIFWFYTDVLHSHSVSDEYGARKNAPDW